MFSGFLKTIFRVINVSKAIVFMPHFLLMRKDGKASILTGSKIRFWNATYHMILINTERFCKEWIIVKMNRRKFMHKLSTTI